MYPDSLGVKYTVNIKRTIKVGVDMTLVKQLELKLEDTKDPFLEKVLTYILCLEDQIQNLEYMVQESSDIDLDYIRIADGLGRLNNGL